MATNPLTAPTTTTDEPVLRWANGEGSVLVASHCPGCLGVGEVLR